MTHGAKAQHPHYHCPHDCENPQPFAGPDGKRYCGRCLHKDGKIVLMFLCSPEVCD